MRRVIAEAEVGDDVFGEDPSVNRLQEVVADLLGKQAALFVPTGSMANQISIRVHTSPGDEVIVTALDHDATVSCQQAVAKNAVIPREFVAAALDIRHQ